MDAHTRKRVIMTQLQDKLKTVFKTYPEIAFAYLFGSYATDEQTAMSDIDIAIFVERKTNFTFNERLLLHGECCRVLQRNDVDILILNTIKNLIIVDEIIRSGKVIYNINPQLLDEFELKTLHIACDFKHQRYREMNL